MPRSTIFRRDLAAICGAATFALLPCTTTFAQACEPQWLPGQRVPGVDGPVYTMLRWDPDGSGPLAPLLIIGGDFQIVEQTRAARIAAWDGRTWHALGDGLNDEVRCLAVFQGDLVAGGKFTRSGDLQVNRVARWDAATGQWNPLGPGIDTGEVHALIEHQDQLIAGGPFTILSNPWTHYVARFDGQGWQRMGQTNLGGAVRALLIHDGMLVAGGVGVVRWDGASWQSLDDAGGPDITVHSLQIHDDRLVAGGNVLTPQGLRGEVWRWDRLAWDRLGDQFDGELRAIAVHDEQLLAAARFATSGLTVRVTQFNGSQWTQVGAGFSREVNALASFGGSLLAAGEFNRVGERAAWRVASLDAQTQSWRPLVVEPVLELGPFVEHNGRWIAAGQFADQDGVTRHSLAEWDSQEQRWLPFGPHIQPLALTVYNGDIIAGGAFTEIDGVPVNRVARWNGTSWQPLGNGMSGNFGHVAALVQFGDDLIAAGHFTHAGGVAANNIARWSDAAGTWQPMGAGLASIFHEDPAYGSALVVFDGVLVVGGLFGRAGGLNARNIAQWDGTGWHALGAGFAGHVRALLAHHDRLIAAGNFGGAPAVPSFVAMWDGRDWHSLINSTSGRVTSATMWRGQLIVGGQFEQIDGVMSRGIARYDGDAWHTMDGGVGGSLAWVNFGRHVDHIAVRDDTLFVGGNFSTVGEVVSFNYAHAIWPTAPADLNCDGVVNVNDLLTVINAWGACPPPPQLCPADIAPQPNGDGVVNVIDLLMVINNWG